MLFAFCLFSWMIATSQNLNFVQLETTRLIICPAWRGTCTARNLFIIIHMNEILSWCTQGFLQCLSVSFSSTATILLLGLSSYSSSTSIAIIPLGLQGAYIFTLVTWQKCLLLSVKFILWRQGNSKLPLKVSEIATVWWHYWQKNHQVKICETVTILINFWK